eukprot:snap_masked-scaffold_22-processed-gene-5.26-mRNA-1 protein AED:0.03 eAED:0.03 QI:0/-1/0/1/-1/1/1/0/197
MPNILLCGTGSVATVKIPEIALKLRNTGYNVQICLTKPGEHFLEISSKYNPEVYEDFKEQNFEIFTDKDEWEPYSNVKEDQVLHIELRKWADILLICPLSANTLGKISSGLCDNLVTCVFRAWDFTDPVLLCPAMNTFMYDNPFTARHLSSVQSLSQTIHFLEPVSKKLACGDVGKGALPPPDSIIQKVTEILPPSQ